MLTAFLLAATLSTGCVQRRMTIRSNPSGALVYIDNYEIGATPVSTDYIYYGPRQFRLVKDGYETLTETRQIRPPWYEYPPLDFLAENVYPGEIRDERAMDFQLVPQYEVPTQQLIGRGEELRQATAAQRAGLGGLAPPAAPAPQLLPAPVTTVPPASAGYAPAYESDAVSSYGAPPPTGQSLSPGASGYPPPGYAPPPVSGYPPSGGGFPAPASPY